MTGGAFKNSSSLLSRRREIEEFEKTVQMLKKDLDEAIASLETHKQERAGYYTKMDALKEEMQKIYVRQNKSFPGAEPPEDHYGAEIRPSS